MPPAHRLDHVRPYAYSGPDIVIRRYLQPDKFVDFAKTGELHFAPASAMSDKEEGFFTLADQRQREQHLKGLRFTDRGLNIARKAWDTVSESNAKAVVLSCWTMGSDEDPRMWAEYGQSSDAVAVETTVFALRDVLGPDFLAVPVRYVDRDTTVLPQASSLEPFFFKGLDYRWENELRWVAEMEIGRRMGSPRRVRVAPGKLCLTFLVAPDAHPTRTEEVEGLLSKLIANPKVLRSRL